MFSKGANGRRERGKALTHFQNNDPANAGLCPGTLRADGKPVLATFRLETGCTDPSGALHAALVSQELPLRRSLKEADLQGRTFK